MLGPPMGAAILDSPRGGYLGISKKKYLVMSDLLKSKAILFGNEHGLFHASSQVTFVTRTELVQSLDVASGGTISRTACR